jgi:hypothetical protein
VQAAEQVQATQAVRFSFFVSFLEIYLEQVHRALGSTGVPGIAAATSGTSLTSDHSQSQTLPWEIKCINEPTADRMCTTSAVLGLGRCVTWARVLF